MLQRNLGLPTAARRRESRLQHRPDQRICGELTFLCRRRLVVEWSGILLFCVQGSWTEFGQRASDDDIVKSAATERAEGA